MTVPKTSKEFADYVEAGGYDFIDFGCSKGASIDWGMTVLGGNRGLGIDISPDKVAAAREAGFDAIEYDLLKIPTKKMVRFTILSHMLEHIPDLNLVEAFIRKACVISKEFVLIRQPYFDSDGMLFQKGLKTYWSDWSGHPNCMSSYDLYRMLERLKKKGLLKTFSIHGRTPIKSSDHPRIHPLSSPINQQVYDSEIHPPKPMGVVFDFPVYFETIVFVTMEDVSSHLKPFAKYPMDTTFIDADGNLPKKQGGAGGTRIKFVGSMATRRTFIEEHTDLDEKTEILEIGALNNPTYERPVHLVKYLDFASKNDLNKQNVNNPRYSLDGLVDVDYIGLNSVERKFDLVIASHVIEHIPNVIGWINNIAKILTDDGSLFLSVPDRRYTFDIARRESNFIDLLRMERTGVEKPDFYQILDHLYYFKDIKVEEAWSGDVKEQLKKMRFTPAKAMEAATSVSEYSYVSVHCHVFTKESFEEMYGILFKLGLLELKIKAISSPIEGSNEFHVMLTAKN